MSLLVLVCNGGDEEVAETAALMTEGLGVKKKRERVVQEKKK